ncbi:MAG: apolipoprotein N-acyltransferase [Pseudomonadota bacterium]
MSMVIDAGPARVARSSWRGDLISLVSGLPIVLGFAPYGWYGVPIVSIAIFLTCLHGVSARRAAARGFLFGIGSFIAGMYWVHISIHQFGGAPLAVALMLMVLLVLYMALYPAVFALVVSVFSTSNHLVRYVLVAPAAWVLLEWARGWLFTGFGWLAVGYSQTDSPLQHVMPVLGVYGASYGALILSGGLAVWFVQRRPCTASALAGLLFVLTAALFGRADWTQSTGREIDVAMVQGAVPQDIKWSPGQLQPTVDLYVRLSDEHLDADLVIWPEAAIPTSRRNLDPLFAGLRQRGKRRGAEFLIGTVDIDEATGQPINTAVVLGKQPEDEMRYVKRHLVPYGEFFPAPDFVLGWIRQLNLPFRDFVRGDAHQPPLRAAGIPIAMSICYEDVFGAELRAMTPITEIMANVSNDAWFGMSIAPHQHLQIARTRALEAGRMIMRSTNNGITAIIDERGRVISRSAQFTPEVLRGVVRGRSGVTPFVRFGNGPVVILAVALLLGALLRGRRRSA